MNKNSWKEYLSFSKKERNGLLVLVTLIVIIFLLPYFFPSANPPFDRQLVAALKTQASMDERGNADTGSGSKRFIDYRQEDQASASRKISTFHFDPNTIDAAGWMRLGLRARTAETIGKYLAHGGKFRRPEDLNKIYGIPRSLASRLIPFVAISQPVTETAAAGKTVFSQRTRYPDKKSAGQFLVDINTADSSGLIRLNGIGPTLASRILKFRDRLGGFFSVQQLREVYGLRDSSFQAMVPHLTLSEVGLRKLHINQADLRLLGSHPYIGRKLAEVFTSYRAQHGDFHSLEELAAIDIMTPEILAKLSPYLTFSD